MQTPQFGQLMVGVCRNLEHLDKLPGTTLVIAGKVEIFGQLCLPTTKCIGQQIIQTLIACFVLADMPDEHLYIDIAVLQGAHVLLEVLGCIEETTGTFLNLVIYLDIGTDIIPIGIEDESHFLHLTSGHYSDKVFGKSSFITKVLNARNSDRRNAVLASLLRFLFTFLDI